jgi:DNA (cytosine-5)-methyltransferase 1
VSTAAVFFEGAGGSTCGLRDAGFTTVGYENWQPAIGTSRANGHTVIPCDLADPANDHLILPAMVGWFSPPCQPFSAAGDGEGEFDDRDGFPWTLRIIDRFRFPVVFIENVKGLTFAKHSAYFGGILAAIRALGYEVDWKVLNCADYGVPQTRERCIIIARNDGGPITWPTPTHTSGDSLFLEPWVSMADALGWGRSGRPFFAIATGHLDAAGVGGTGARAALDRERAEGRWGAAIATGALLLNPHASPAPTVVGSSGCQTPWQWIRPATTIAGDTRVFQPGGHHQPGEQSENAIRCTIAELATLQGFPPGYIFTGTKTAQAKQVGNAVPPRLAQVVAEANQPIALERAA